MLNRPSFEDLYGRLDLSPEGRTIVEQVRSGQPVRNPKSGSQSSAGIFPSDLMGRTIRFESRTLELAYLKLNENRLDLLEYYEQPYQLRLKVRRKDGHAGLAMHTPDLLEISETQIAFVELKYEERLMKKAEEQPGRFQKRPDGGWWSPAAEEALAGTGIGYRVVTERQLNPILLRNITFLMDFREAA